MNAVETLTQLRLTQDLLEQADALIAVMAADPEVLALGIPTRAAVLRLAIAHGLQDLKRQYQAPVPAHASAPSPTTTPHDATPGSHQGTFFHVHPEPITDGAGTHRRGRRIDAESI
ncbi:MAG TPA: hypothetical protein VLK82_06605 [Candidatus Tectomicrobia bacterium]|nr:hypothetical protein [Candidatus Tectomicrobia bacterium]